MAPARNLLRRHCDSYGGFFIDHAGVQRCEFSGLMAEKAAQSGGRNDQQEKDKEEEKQDAVEVAAASGEEGAGSYRGWLQLGIGSDLPRPSQLGAVARGDPTAGTSRGGAGDLTELNLFFMPRPSRPLFGSAATMAGYGHPWWFQGGRRPGPGASSSTMAPPPLMQSSWRQFMHPAASLSPSLGFGGGIRVVGPPPRPPPGMWLVLKAAENQVKEPFLPQITRSYLRIKDGRMTARILMKYLADKLGLEDGSEVQISCRGQQIPPLMTLQQVRDQIWCATEATLLTPESLSTDHLMTLYYSRSG